MTVLTRMEYLEMKEKFRIQPEVFGLFRTIQFESGSLHNTKRFRSEEDNICIYFVAFHSGDNYLEVRFDTEYL